MTTAKIAKIEKATIVKTGERFLDVTVEIKEGRKIVEVRKLGYPLDTKSGDIEKDLKKMLKVREQEAIQAVEQVKVDKVEAKADTTIELLKDKELN
jgi:uncharacterized protein YlzI (FlbEa/FlbD family)